MKPGSYFINVGRGSVVVHDALVHSLEIGHLAGAGFDVCEPEPLPEAHPLWNMHNVVITPHVGGPVGNAGSDDGATVLREFSGLAGATGFVQSR